MTLNTDIVTGSKMTVSKERELINLIMLNSISLFSLPEQKLLHC